MHVRFLLLSFLITCVASAQLQSPEQFLGYRVGTRYTPHWQIVQYFRHVAASKPDMVRLQEYGKTNEGRPLLVVYVSSPANLVNLETIRQNNLRLAGLSDDRQGGSTQNPVPVVWLSYNVHGNETSSSEAAMQTLHALVDPGNTRSRQWLQNTMVVMDPCLNPDGRDRYVNWFNSVVGKKMNPLAEAREHREPWPGGRTNHYNFDLNRDWAWQTQLETRQRLPLFQQWMPQIHVDFHEQGINAPYYFAPAAQPYHEVITDWQRSFQNTIGRNHARYFDEKGWLYFTREVFDLLYPSYGDTYPIYNGSIGMTYEQGGGPAGGLGVINEDGDTLTLEDRVAHHYTTGLSTIETASQHAEKLVNEFRNFYAAAGKGVGNYGSYVIRNNPRDRERISALADLLRKNNIRFGRGKSAGLRGYDYDSGREEAFTLSEGDLVIPAAQPKGVLVRVLMEPQTRVVDSLTYDITAWSLPYVYGLEAFATRQAVALTQADWTLPAVTNPVADPYAYVVRWTGTGSVKLVSGLLQRGVKLRFAEQPFTVNGQNFDPGSVIILKTSNQYTPNLWTTVRSLADSNRVQLQAVSTGMVDKGYDFGSSRVRPLKARKVALLTGEGVNGNAAGEVWHFMEQTIDYPVTLVNNTDFARVDWETYDVIILPDGAYRFLSDKAQAERLKNWVAGGGQLIALENAVGALARAEFGIKSKKADDGEPRDAYEPLRAFENRERENLHSVTPGSIYRVTLDNSHPLAFGYPSTYYTLKQDDALYEFIQQGGWNVGVLKKEAQVAGFVGRRLAQRLQDGLLFGTQELGRGTVTYLADDVLFRNFWENGKLLFSNALFMVGQ